MHVERQRAVDILMAIATDYQALSEKPQKDRDVVFIASEISNALIRAANHIKGPTHPEHREAAEQMRAFTEKRPTKHDLGKHIKT